MTEVAPETFRIGEWSLQRNRNLLTRNGTAHVLEPRAVELLVYLAARQGQVVSLEALHGELWAGRVVTDSSVYRLIAELRRLLGDDARSPRYIETVRKRGYRLVAEVTAVEADASVRTGTDTDTKVRAHEWSRDGASTATPAPPRAGESPGRRPGPGPAAAPLRADGGSPGQWPHRIGVPLAAALLIVAAAALVRLQPTVPDTAAPATLAVVPLEPLAPDTPQHLLDGLARTLSDRLAAIAGIDVIAYTSVRAAAQEHGTPAAIAAAVGADLLVSGSMLVADATAPAGQRVRMSLSLVNAEKGVTRWTDTFELQLADLFELHERLAADVSRALDLALSGDLPPEARRTQAAAPEVVDAWLRGGAALEAGFQMDSLEAAIGHFDSALAQQPDFVPALTGRAVAHLQLYANYHDRSEARIALARADADRALALAPDSPEALYARGQLAAHTADLKTAEDALRRALARRPSHARAEVALARVAARGGRQEEALERLRTAVSLDPLNPVYRYQLGLQQLFTGHFAEADRNFSAAIGRNPAMVEPYIYRAWLQIAWLADRAVANDRLRELRNAVGEQVFLETLLNAGLWGFFTWTAADIDRLLETSPPAEAGVDPATWQLAMAEIAFKEGRRDMARFHWAEAARLRADDLADTPASPWLLAELAIAEAGLDHREAAMRAADRAVALQPVSVDQWEGTDFLWVRATVLAMLGDVDAAIAQVAAAARYPTLTTPNALRADPHWTDVVDDPHFRAISSHDGARWQLTGN